MKVGGLQCVITNDAYVLPLNIVNGLPYLPMRPHMDEEWEKLPHVPLTQDNEKQYWTGPGQTLKNGSWSSPT